MDLKNFAIEEMMMRYGKPPVFFVYYCTNNGDILGKLLLTEYEMIFEPLNDSLKGYFSYGHSNILTNTKMGFIIAYSDIISNASSSCHIEALEENDDDVEERLLYHINLKLSHTGFYFVANNEQKERISKLNQEGKHIASISLKIAPISLLGERRPNDIRKIISEIILKQITKWQNKATQLEEKEHSTTIVPAFDINFTGILDIPANIINGAMVEERLAEVTELFGFSNHVKSIMQLNNESMVSLQTLFPLLQQPEEQLLNKETLIERSRHSQKKHNATYVNISDEPLFKEKFEGSQLLTLGTKKWLEHSIPIYVYDSGWQLLYARSLHGFSFNTYE